MAIVSEGVDANTAIAAVHSTGQERRLFLKKMPHSSPEHISFHLDLNVSDREAEVELYILRSADAAKALMKMLPS